MKNTNIVLILFVGMTLSTQLQCSKSKEDVKSGSKCGKPHAGLKCSIRPIEGPSKRGDIKFIFTLENVSDEVIHLPETTFDMDSGLWIAMTGEKGERFLQVTSPCPIEIHRTVTDRTTITEISPGEKIEIPGSYGGYSERPTVRFWSGLIIDSDIVPDTYDGWTGSIASNVIEVNVVE